MSRMKISYISKFEEIRNNLNSQMTETNKFGPKQLCKLFRSINNHMKSIKKKEKIKKERMGFGKSRLFLFSPFLLFY